MSKTVFDVTHMQPDELVALQRENRALRRLLLRAMRHRSIYEDNNCTVCKEIREAHKHLTRRKSKK